MEKVTEGQHTGEFILSEANGYRSRETVDLAESQDVQAGEVLGQVTASGEYVAWAPGAADGSEVVAGISYAAAETGEGETKPITLFARDGEVDLGALVYPEGQQAGAVDGLADLNIHARARGATE